MMSLTGGRGFGYRPTMWTYDIFSQGLMYRVVDMIVDWHAPCIVH